MRPIVITGARGYIGAALVGRLAGEGRTLRLVSRPSSVLVAGATGANIEVIHADLAEETAWCRLLREAAAVVHLSARTDLRAAEADRRGDELLNVEPVRALVRAAEKADEPPTVVFASTVTIFGPQHVNPASECTADNPCSVYDCHKVACETILREATVAGALRACTLRLANVYGLGTAALGSASVNSNRGILNVMMRRALNGEPLTIYGEGTYVRDFVHVEDVVDAFTRAADAGGDVCDGDHYIIATGRGHTLAEAYRVIAEAALTGTGRPIEIKHVPEPSDLHPIERRNFVGNSSLFQQRAGWRPRISLREGIERFFAAEATRSQVASRRKQ